MKKEVMHFDTFAEMYAYLRGKTIEIKPIEVKVEEKPKKTKKKEAKK